jgi:hypothetical protein
MVAPHISTSSTPIQANQQTLVPRRSEENREPKDPADSYDGNPGKRAEERHPNGTLSKFDAVAGDQVAQFVAMQPFMTAAKDLQALASTNRFWRWVIKNFTLGNSYTELNNLGTQIKAIWDRRSVATQLSLYPFVSTTARLSSIRAMKNDKTIEERHKKALLSKMASNPALTPNEQREVRTLAASFEDEANKAMVLESLAANPALISEERNKIRTLAASFESVFRKESVFNTLASNPALSPEERSEIYTQAVSFVEESNKASVLNPLASNPALSPEERSEIYTQAVSFVEESNKAMVLEPLAGNPALTSEERNKIRTLAASFMNESNRAFVLAVSAGRYPWKLD